MHPLTSVVIPAAGSGSRMKAHCNKQFLELAGKPVIAHTLLAFDRCIYVDELIVVVKKEELESFEQLVASLHLSKPYGFALGGETRQASVWNGIKACRQTAEFIAVHDGARPFISGPTLDRVFKDAYTLKSIITAVPSKDTVKRVDSDGVVIETLKRSELWNVQTPQIFEKKRLEKAYEEAILKGYDGTDDASLVEWVGYDVYVVMGSYQNIKITTPEDLVVGEMILKDQA